MKEYLYLGSNIALTRVGGYPIMFDTRDVGMVGLLTHDFIYEPDVWHAVTALVRPGMTFIDVGAKVGIHTVVAGRTMSRQGKILSLEPNPRIFALLKQNIALNGLLGTAEAFQKAAYDQPGTSRFSTDPLQHRVGTLVIDGAINYGTESYDVEVVTIDSLRPKIDCHPVVMKVDVEGREAGVIEGARGLMEEVDDFTLIFEFHRRVMASIGVAVPDFVADLEARGLRFFTIDSAKRAFLPLPAATLAEYDRHINVVATRRSMES
jgi:FkbM family methyltransferase